MLPDTIIKDTNYPYESLALEAICIHHTLQYPPMRFDDQRIPANGIKQSNSSSSYQT